MSTIKPSYAAPATITCTLASLANGSSRQSAVVDNSSTLYDDALLSLIVATGSGTIGNGRLMIWGYGLMDTTPTYTDGCMGADAAFSGTPSNGTNMKLIGVVYAGAASTTFDAGPFSVANAFGGRLPEKWGVVVQNDTGVPLSSAAATLEYIGMQYTVG
ncbi:MAG: hypothetical protein ACYCW6_00060 [Candidatus Xenobia bacterium]